MLSVLPPWLTRNDGWEGVGHGGGAQSTAQRRTGRRGEGAVRGTTASKAWPVRGSGRELKAGCAGAPEAFALRGLQSGAGNSRRPRTRHTRTTSACPCPHAASAAAPARPGGASGGRGGPLCCALGERPPPLTPQPPPSVKSSGTPGWWPCPLRNARNAERGRNCQRGRLRPFSTPSGMEGKSVLVTGGTGYIGSHTVLALLEAGASVVILDNLVNSCEEVLPRLRELAGAAVSRMAFVKVCAAGWSRDEGTDTPPRLGRTSLAHTHTHSPPLSACRRTCVTRTPSRRCSSSTSAWL